MLDRALSYFAADDGGFHDTAADAEALVARPRDPSDNASPSGQSALVHALLHYAAVTGSGRHRDAAEAALRQVRTLAERAPRFAGWSLAAAEAALDGPLEVAVVGAPGDPACERAAAGRAGQCAPRAGRGRRSGRPERRCRCSRGAGSSTDRPAAYVCRGMVCERPVTGPGELSALL